MSRTMTVFLTLVVMVLAPGYGGPAPEAAPRKRPVACKDEVASLKVQLADQTRRAEMAEEMVKTQLESERRRVRILEERIGQLMSRLPE